MSIERDPEIRFHEQGTLNAVTRWIATHDEGLAEWLKNVRRAYQSDRADVDPEHRHALLLLKDEAEDRPARIGVLDVGGATLEDVTAWSTWQDPDASSRSSGVAEEETQGNGGKAYMYRLFRGPAEILGARDGTLNRKGFEGVGESVERGTPGFIPDAASGREVPIVSVDAALAEAIAPYDISVEDLPPALRGAIDARQAFTLVEAVDPVDFYRGRIDVDNLLWKTIRHEQSTLALQQVDFYALHDGRLLNEGNRLELPEIAPYPGLEAPTITEIPDDLPLSTDRLVSTTEGGTRPKGRLILLTSKDHMPYAYKNLKPRWKIQYRTEHQMVGSKPVSDFAPTTPGAAFVYGILELEALEPGYVEHGRRRPKDGPLVEALARFISERIKELAGEITSRRREDLDERALDEVHEQNQKLDQFKNQFLSDEDAPGGDGGSGDDGDGPVVDRPPPPDYGTVPESIEMVVPDPALRLACGVGIHMKRVLGVRILDALGRAVPGLELTWTSSDPRVAAFDGDDLLVATRKGQTDIKAEIVGEGIESPTVTVEAWEVDHVLLTPREMEIPLAKRQRITAEVTNDEGERATDVYLRWSDSSDDPLTVRIRPSGWVTGNRIGRTEITAGAGDPGSGVWARIPVEVTVVPNPEEPDRGGGFPRLLLTGRDIDPSTDEVREGDPDAPVLWQEVTDYRQNVWWLNLQSPEAAFAFGQIEDAPALWRQFHVDKVMAMVTQVLMQNEFTRRGENERQAYWADHKQALDRHEVQTMQQMWEALQPYVLSGGDLP